LIGETGFPNQIFNDSWMVGFWRADHGGHDVEVGRRAWTLAQAIPGSLRHKARRRMCPLYIAGLIGPGDRKSVQPMAARLAPGEYDQLHHFIADGVWDAAPLEAELLVQADCLVGGKDAVRVIDDTAMPKNGRSFGWCRSTICLVSRQDGQLPNIGVADACTG
jgi:SRSO17 transposase